MLAFGVSQTLGKICHGVVKCQTSYRQFRLFRLLLLVFSRTLLGSPFILLLLIHFIHIFYLRSPSINHGVDASLTGCEVTGNVGDEVQRVHLAVDRYLYASSQHSDGWTDGGNHGHCQGGPHRIERIPYAQRHSRQSVVIEQIVLGISLVQRIDQRIAAFGTSALCSPQLHSLLSDGSKHIFQSLRHLRNLLV